MNLRSVYSCQYFVPDRIFVWIQVYYRNAAIARLITILENLSADLNRYWWDIPFTLTALTVANVLSIFRVLFTIRYNK
jgi:hypothetical protein